MMPAQYVMIGGFLGAGKTTAVGQLGAYLQARGRRVGLITNDQSVGLVDTGILRSQGFTVQEITGGCFCCRFDSLRQAAVVLEEEARPDVFVAEPVGSCTDLVATVSYPLRRMYGDSYRIAPLSVLVDPQRAARMFGLVEGRRFSPKVAYVFLKQLEEADLLVVNKVDTTDPALIAQLTEALSRRFPGVPVLPVSCTTGAGLEDWFARVLDADAARRPTMEVNYTTYAEGEALLGWLNATVNVETVEPTDADGLLHALANDVRSRLGGVEAGIAHLKMTLDPHTPLGEIAVVSMVDDDQPAHTRHRLAEPFSRATLVVNLRAEAAPEALERALDGAMVALRGVHMVVEHYEAFRPSPPVPTHRDVEAS